MKYNNLLLNSTLLILGIAILMIGAKMTPQWLELQGSSRFEYLPLAFLFLVIGLLILYKPIIAMIKGSRFVISDEVSR